MDRPSSARRDLARGAGSVMLSRIGALVDVVATPAYAWMFGIAGFGAYAALWAAISIVQTLLEAGTTAAVQRLMPRLDGNDAGRMAGAALFVAVAPTIVVAAIASINAARIADLLHLPAGVLRDPTSSVALFAWALPLWAALEVSTAVLRSRRTFGAEVRLRILWEQTLRLGLAFGAWCAGAGLEGLLLAHLVSLALAGAASLRLVALGGRPLQPRARDVAGLLGAGLPTLPLAIVWRVFIDLPPVVVPLLSPGPAGLAGAGLYAIARKLSSSLTLVKQIFSYVLAPIAASERADPVVIRDLHGFAGRCSAFLTLPFWAVMIAAGPTLLDAYADGGRAAYPLLVVLATARMVEALLGPSGTIQQVAAHPALATLNAVIGGSVFAIVLLACPAGPLGAALATASGQIAVALASAIHVRAVLGIGLAPGLRPSLARGHVLGLSVVVCAAGIAGLVAPWAGAILVVASGSAGAWLSAWASMPDADRAAMGSLARRMRLTPPPKAEWKKIGNPRPNDNGDKA